MSYARTPISLLTICLTIVVLASTASAEFVPRVAIETDEDGHAYILVNDEKAIQLKTFNGSLSPIERANIAATRLKALVEKELDLKTIWYKRVGQTARVMVADSLLVIATADEARKQKVSSVKLAQSWVQDLRKLLSLPPLSVDRAALLVPLGEARAVKVRSLIAAPVELDVSDASVITVDVETEPGALIVTGASVGDATMTIRCEDYTTPVQVSDRKYAARMLSAKTKAVVTGWDAPASVVSLAARDAACRAISLEPGAKLSSLKVEQAAHALSPNQVFETPVQIQAAGDDYIPAKLNARVAIENQPLSPAPTSWIMYSNDPERLLKYQTLFVGRTTSTESAVRLLYHHQNMMKRRIGFVIDVVNPSDSAAAVHVIEATPQPMIDTVGVGYTAGLAFLQNLRSMIGRVIEIPPGTRRVIVSQPLDHRHTASGILELRQLTGEPLFVRAIAKPEGLRVSQDPEDIAISATGVDPAKVAISTHVYPNPTKKLSVTYAVGKPWVFLRLGKDALKHASEEKQLHGNYGVIYEIEAKIENPLSRPHTVELAFEATAGPAGGIFIVDGNIVRVKSLRPPGERSLGKVTIPAGRSRVVSIRTMPLSGSAYPATLIIRPAGIVPSRY